MTAPTQARERPVLRTDGGEQEAEESDEGEDSEADEEPEQADESADADEEEAADEAEDGEDEEESDRTGEDDEATGLVFLDLEGLFLDVLGLEVDLNEVVLDVRAAPGEGNLLGNLLGQVAQLLDPGSLGDFLPDLGDLVPDLGGEDGFLSNLPARAGGWLRDMVADIVEELELQEMLSDVIEGFLQELVDGLESSGGDE